MTDAPEPAAPTSAHPDRSRSALSGLGRMVAHRPWTVLVTWALLVAGGFAVASGAFGGDSLFHRLHSGEPTVSGQNSAGRDLLAAAGGSQLSTYTVRVVGVDLRTARTQELARGAAQRVRAVQGVSSVSPAVPGPDGFAAVVTLRGTPNRSESARIAHDVLDAYQPLRTAVPSARVSGGGLSDLVDAITGQLEVDLRTGEGIALPVSFVVMVVVFGGFVAAGMPILGAVASIAGALASLLGFSYAIDLDASAVNVVTVLGLGLCIDYGLLTVSRFREELQAQARGVHAAQITGDMVNAAAARTVDSAGRTVVFSGLTVAISLGGLLVFEAQLMKAIGAAGLSVVLVAMLVALTAVPALCVLGARRLVRRGTETAPDTGVFSRLANAVRRRPVPVVLVVLAALGALAAPALGLRLTSSGAAMLPAGSATRQFFDGLARDYPQLGGADISVVAVAPLDQTKQYAATLHLPPGSRVTAVSAVGKDLSVVRIDTPGGALDDPARAAVRGLESQHAPFRTYVTGQASGLNDFVDSMWRRAPWAFALVAVATLVLLFLMTGSVVIPVKALLMNVVSLGASLGVVVWVFQQGHLAGPLGFTPAGGVESTIPLLVLAFGFGLSMDYEVFLLSRIVELHERGLDNDQAVVLGLQRSGRIITSAALLVVIVFSGFVAGKLLIIKETGIGLATAVAVDATLVRMLLVPATMTLLGDWNWWAPARLRRWHSRFGITE